MIAIKFLKIPCCFFLFLCFFWTKSFAGDKKEAGRIVNVSIYSRHSLPTSPPIQNVFHDYGILVEIRAAITTNSVWGDVLALAQLSRSADDDEPVDFNRPIVIGLVIVDIAPDGTPTDLNKLRWNPEESERDSPQKKHAVVNSILRIDLTKSMVEVTNEHGVFVHKLPKQLAALIPKITSLHNM
jgi:hypothetical protein